MSAAPFVDLDHNATTPICPAAAAAVIAAMGCGGNPSSVHRAGRAARRLIEDSREKVAALVSASPSSVIFTSGGSEANALALLGCGRSRALVSAIEHASVLAVRAAERIGVDRRGIVDVDALADRLAASTEPAIVSVMLANNETGVLQPVAEVVAVARQHGALVHCDAAQAVGRIAVDMTSLGVDYLTLSAHKLGGPLGAGALIVAPGAPLRANLGGGGQERGRRAGTENVPGIAGFGAAAAACAAGLFDGERLRGLRDELEVGVQRLSANTEIFGRDAPRLPNTSCLTMPGVTNERQVIAFDMRGIGVSAGAACSSGKVGPSHVLAAMGVADTCAMTAIRVSLGWTTTANDIARFLMAWAEISSGSAAAATMASAA